MSPASAAGPSTERGTARGAQRKGKSEAEPPFSRFPHPRRFWRGGFSSQPAPKAEQDPGRSRQRLGSHWDFWGIFKLRASFPFTQRKIAAPESRERPVPAPQAPCLSLWSPLCSAGLRDLLPRTEREPPNPRKTGDRESRSCIHHGAEAGKSGEGSRIRAGIRGKGVRPWSSDAPAQTPLPAPWAGFSLLPEREFPEISIPRDGPGERSPLCSLFAPAVPDPNSPKEEPGDAWGAGGIQGRTGTARGHS